MHLQVQKNDAATKDGGVHAPSAISDSKAKAEEAKQEKDKKKWQQEMANKWPQPRAGLAAAALDGQDGDGSSSLLPPPTSGPSGSQWPDKGWKGGKNRGKDKGKGGAKGCKKGKEKGRLREPRLSIQP